MRARAAVAAAKRCFFSNMCTSQTQWRSEPLYKRFQSNLWIMTICGKRRGVGGYHYYPLPRNNRAPAAGTFATDYMAGNQEAALEIHLPRAAAFLNTRGQPV